MEDYSGVLEFEYFGERKRVPYTMDNLGGNTHVYFQDKHGVHHIFFYRKSTGQWILSGNYVLNWPKDLMDVLFECFDLARKKHGL